MNDDLPTRRSEPDYPTTVELLPGSKLFGRYTLRTLLGRGGMGVVWRARDDELDREVALKFILAAVAADREAVRDLKRETKRCLDLTHPNIVRVYDFVQDAHHAAIAMEFVEGQSLSSRKADAPAGCLGVTELAPLVVQLCAALDYAHTRAKIAHRDLKPANLLVTADGQLKVTDFGIACSLAETATGLTGRARDTSGTLPFMSPQQVAGEKPTAADDIYALGATLYDLLTSRPPFHRGDPFSVMKQISERAPLAPMAQRKELEISGEPIPKNWEDTIVACLAKHPAARPAGAAEVGARLGLAGVVQPAGFVPQVPGKHRWRAAAALVAVAALAGGAIFFWRKSETKQTPAGPVAGGATRNVAAPELPAEFARNPPATPPAAATPAPAPADAAIVRPAPGAEVASAARAGFPAKSSVAPAGGPGLLVGMPEADLLQLKGQPTSKLATGTKAILQWPDVSVTINDGRVEGFKWIDQAKKRADDAAAQAALTRRIMADEQARRRAEFLAQQQTRNGTPPSAEQQTRAELTRKETIVRLETEIKSAEAYLDKYARQMTIGNKGKDLITASQAELTRSRLEEKKRELSQLQ